MLHILLEMPFPRVQLYDVLCLAPHFHGILCVCACGLAAPSTGRAQERALALLSPACLCLLPCQPLGFSIYFQFSGATNGATHSLLSAALHQGPCLVLRRVKQHDTDGETKASREEVNLPRSASRGKAGSSPGSAVAAWESWARETCCADQLETCQHLSCSITGRAPGLPVRAGSDLPPRCNTGTAPAPGVPTVSLLGEQEVGIADAQTLSRSGCFVSSSEKVCLD